MNADDTKKSLNGVTKPENALIDEVHRRLVRIHNAIAIRTSDDATVIPWAERELMRLIEDVGMFRRDQERLAAEASESARA